MSKKYLVTQDQTVDGMPLEGSAVVHYTTCSTAAATAAKTAALSGFKLGTGAFVIVKFSVTNTAASPTLNVNNTGAKAIRYKNAAISAGYLAANKTYFFVYDGTYWQLVGDVDTNTTYSAATTTAAGLMSVADKTKLNNTQSINAVVQGTISSLTASLGNYYIPNNPKGTKALVEYWSDVSGWQASTSNGTTTKAMNYSNYGSRYLTGISSSMTAVSASSILNGSARSISVAVDASGRPYFSGSVSTADHYRITWYL